MFQMAIDPSIDLMIWIITFFLNMMLWPFSMFRALVYFFS